jgi:hypothetical protein
MYAIKGQKISRLALNLLCMCFDFSRRGGWVKLRTAETLMVLSSETLTVPRTINNIRGYQTRNGQSEENLAQRPQAQLQNLILVVFSQPPHLSGLCNGTEITLPMSWSISTSP